MMKCRKGLVAGVVAVCMMGAMGVNAFAADADATKKTEVKYTVTQAYTWSVPTSITFESTGNTITTSGNSGATQDVCVTQNVIEEGKKLHITATGNVDGDKAFTIALNKSNDNKKLNYTVYVNDNGSSSTSENKLTPGGTVLDVPAGTNTGSATLKFELTKDTVEIAGEYEGTITYTASVVSQTETASEEN